jgi:excisionase family DNA binding protein
VEDLLTGKEAAAYLRVSLSTVVSLRNQGKLAFVRIGRKVLYKKSALEAFTTANEQTNPTV